MADEIKAITANHYSKLAAAKLPDAVAPGQLEKAALHKNSEKMAGYDEKSEMQKAANDFEAMLLQDMLKSMWQTVPSEGMLSGSREEALYRDMLNEALSKNIAENKSLGIRDVILREFNKR